jgi:hypothetical protein
MPAYALQLFDLKCSAGKTARASQQVFNRFNQSVGRFCARCAKRRVKELNAPDRPSWDASSRVLPAVTSCDAALWIERPLRPVVNTARNEIEKGLLDYLKAHPEQELTSAELSCILQHLAYVWAQYAVRDEREQANAGT